MALNLYRLQAPQKHHSLDPQYSEARRFPVQLGKVQCFAFSLDNICQNNLPETFELEIGISNIKVSLPSSQSPQENPTTTFHSRPPS